MKKLSELTLTELLLLRIEGNHNNPMITAREYNAVQVEIAKRLSQIDFNTPTPDEQGK